MNNIYQILTEEDLEYSLTNSENKLVVLNFSATWCGPCKQMKPYFIEFSKKYQTTLFLTINIDEYNDKKFKFKESVKSLPTYMAYYNKQRVHAITVTGFDPQTLEKKIKDFLSNQKIPVFKAPSKLPNLPEIKLNESTYPAFDGGSSFTSLDSAYKSSLLSTPAVIPESASYLPPMSFREKNMSL